MPPDLLWSVPFSSVLILFPTVNFLSCSHHGHPSLVGFFDACALVTRGPCTSLPPVPHTPVSSLLWEYIRGGSGKLAFLQPFVLQDRSSILPLASATCKDGGPGVCWPGQPSRCLPGFPMERFSRWGILWVQGLCSSVTPLDSALCGIPTPGTLW